MRVADDAGQARRIGGRTALRLPSVSSGRNVARPASRSRRNAIARSASSDVVGHDVREARAERDVERARVAFRRRRSNWKRRRGCRAVRRAPRLRARRACPARGLRGPLRVLRSCAGATSAAASSLRRVAIGALGLRQRLRGRCDALRRSAAAARRGLARARSRSSAAPAARSTFAAPSSRGGFASCARPRSRRPKASRSSRSYSLCVACNLRAPLGFARRVARRPRFDARAAR